MYQIDWLKQLGTSFLGRSLIARQFRYGCHERRRPSIRPCLENLEERCLLSGGITSPTGLVNAISAANSSGSATTITLASGTTFDFKTANNSTNGGNALPVVTGNITIVGNGDVLERTGASTVFRFFDVAGGGSLTLQNLILQGGLAEGQGSTAQNRGTAAEGGAIFGSGALLNLTGVTVLSSEAVATSSGNAYGGGIYYDGGGSVFLSNCLINANKVIGVVGGNAGFNSKGGNGGEGAGGGVCVYGASRLTLVDDTFNGNEALGGQAGDAGQVGTGGTGGTARGGGLFVLYTPTAIISSDNFTANEAIGPHGGTAGTRGAVGFGGNGGLAEGGGLFVDASNLTLNADSISDNAAVGGNGGNGHSVPGGGIGPGGSGGSAFGGGVYTTNLPSLPVLLGTMINQDTVIAGAAGQPGAGPGQQSPVPGDPAAPLFYGSAMTLTPNRPLPSGTVGKPYATQTITALSAYSTASTAFVSYNFTFTSSPLGLNFSKNGNQLTISGTPTAAGTVTFTVTAADSDGSTQPQDYSLAINSPTTLTPGNATATFNTVGLSVPITATITSPSSVVLSGTVTFTVLNATGSVVVNVQAFVVNGQAQATLNLPSLPAGNYTITESYHDSYGNFSDSSGNGHLIIKPPPPSGGGSGGTGTGSGGSGGAGTGSRGSVTLKVPPLLESFDSLLGGIETVNANGTETVTDNFFGFPLLVSTFDSAGNLASVDLFGLFDITLLFELL